MLPCYRFKCASRVIWTTNFWAVASDTALLKCVRLVHAHGHFIFGQNIIDSCTKYDVVAFLYHLLAFGSMTIAQWSCTRSVLLIGLIRVHILIEENKGDHKSNDKKYKTLNDKRRIQFHINSPCKHAFSKPIKWENQIESEEVDPKTNILKTRKMFSKIAILFLFSAPAVIWATPFTKCKRESDRTRCWSPQLKCRWFFQVNQTNLCQSSPKC